MLVLLLPVAVAVVFGTAYLVVSMAAPRARVGRWLALWLAVWTEVVLTVEVLSLLDAVTAPGFLICYAAFGAVAVAVWLKRGKPRVRLLTLPRRGQIGRAASRHPALTVLLVVVAVCGLVNLLLAVGLPVNNYDANTYHLSRVGYWIQNRSTDHYFTYNERQNFMPPNAEFGILSMLVFARAEWPAPLAQYVAYFVCLAAVYFIARELGASNAAALFAALVLGTMTEIVLQATIPKNGLVMSSFLACAVGFALVGLRALPPAPQPTATDDAPTSKKRRKKGRKQRRPAPEPAAVQTDTRIRAIVWSALGLGLAVGTKSTGLLFVPGLAIAGIVFAVGAGKRATWPARLAAWAGCCAAGIVLLGSLNFVRNAASYGSFTAPPRFAADTRIARLTARSLASNLARYGYHFCDFGGLLPRAMARSLAEARASVAPGIFDGLGIVANAPDLNVAGGAGDFPVDDEAGRFDSVPRLHEDSAWFGPIAFFVGLPLVLVHLVYSPVRRRWAWFGVALTPVVYWLVVSALLRYSIWNGRYFVTAVVAGAPFLSLAYRPTKRRGVQHAVTWLLVCLAVCTALTATFYSATKPIVPRPARDQDIGKHLKVNGVLTRERARLRCVTSLPAYTLCILPEDVFPERMTLGVVLGSDEWDWYLFGPRLRRTLVPLPPDSKRVADAFASGEVDMVAIRKTNDLAAMPPILGERPFLVPVKAESDMHRANDWSFVLHREGDADLFFPARDWKCVPDGFWMRMDQQFVPVRKLPAGRVLLAVRPPPAIVSRTPLVFTFFAGGKEIKKATLTTAEQRRFSLRWTPGPNVEDQILRIRVSSPNPGLNAEIQAVFGTHVYLLYGLPTFVAEQPN